MVHVNPLLHEAFMHPLKGKKQSAAHIAKRMVSFKKTRRANPWTAGRPANTPEVLWSKVDKRGANECWPWLGQTKEGYGRTEIDDIAYYAHRVIYNLVHPGVISLKAPRDRNAWGFLRHSCDNLICCNPKHLIPGTHQQNMDDKVERDRIMDYGADRGPRCKLTMEQARYARELRKAGVSARDLASRFDVSLPSMKTLLRGDSYKEDD
jgi:hypothetical protein